MCNIKPTARIESFENLGFGMFIHWGLYSQKAEGEWCMAVREYPLNEYRKLFDTFTAKDFNAEAVAELAVNAGMKYICLTTRHHEGFSLYDTCGLNQYDAPHSPAGRDLVAEFVAACRKYNIVPFFYHTTLDWNWEDKKTPELSELEFKRYLKYLYDSVEILCTRYGKIGGLWFDGNWSRKDMDWEVEDLYSMIRRHQPEAMIINNTGILNPGELGSMQLDAVTYENQAATPMNHIVGGKYIAGETCLTFNRHWGIGKNDFDLKSPADLIKSLCFARRVGTNFLLNIGPAAQGGIPQYEASALEIVGKWMKIYGEACYIGRPCEIHCSTQDDFVLQTKDGRVFYFAENLSISGDDNVTVSNGICGLRSIYNLPSRLLSAKWMDNGEELDLIYSESKKYASINFTGYHYGNHHVIRVAELFFK